MKLNKVEIAELLAPAVLVEVIIITLADASKL